MINVSFFFFWEVGERSKKRIFYLFKHGLVSKIMLGIMSFIGAYLVLKILVSESKQCLKYQLPLPE